MAAISIHIKIKSFGLDTPINSIIYKIQMTSEIAIITTYHHIFHMSFDTSSNYLRTILSLIHSCNVPYQDIGLCNHLKGVKLCD